VNKYRSKKSIAHAQEKLYHKALQNWPTIVKIGDVTNFGKIIRTTVIEDETLTIGRISRNMRAQLKL